MYLKAWLQGLLDIPAVPIALREKLAAMSLETLREKLREVAPQDYEKIDIQNRRRVERALEIFLMSGQESSQKKTQWREPRSENPFCIILQRDKDSLRERIHQRVDEMFRRGLVEETESLLRMGLEKNRTAMQAIGYRQVVAYLRGEGGTLAETIEEVKTRTRQFAKRQRTWFRSQMPYARELEAAQEVNKEAQQIAEEYRIYRDQ
jgi:tRNA dimethylallyltransferase